MKQPEKDSEETSDYGSHSRLEDDESQEQQLMPPPSSWFSEEKEIIVDQQTTRTDVDPPREESATAPDDESLPHDLPSHISTFTDPLEEESAIRAGQLPVTILQQNPIVAKTHPSPSWKEISSQVLPAAARELLSSSLRRIFYTARVGYQKGRWHKKYSDIGSNLGGFSSAGLELSQDLPPFSSLPWVDRQLVKEWRTYNLDEQQEEDGEDLDFDQARTLVPTPYQRPKWQKQEVCHDCHKPFGPTRLRHHCRLCGNSFCQSHSSRSHSLPHLGYDPEVPERVCDSCKRLLRDQNLAERVAWRLARCRDYSAGNLTPYFEVGYDSYEQVVKRITKAAIAMAKSIPLGAQATVAVETVDVLRKYGLTGIYGIMLRQEFLAAADLLRRALGINKSAWPLSVHELSAAIFYALAQHRAMRGLNPEHEERIHKLRQESTRQIESVSTWTGRDGKLGAGDEYEVAALSFHSNTVLDSTDTYNANDPVLPEKQDSFKPVCDAVSDNLLSTLSFYAPIALNFIYATKEVDMQLLAAQQGWRLLYAFLEQDKGHEGPAISDRPASAVFVHQELKVACLSVRGTATINDVITDIRQIPVPFPDTDPEGADGEANDEWTSVLGGQGLALSGMASAATNLFREHIDSLVTLARQGYRIRITGHSLGGGVATLIGILVMRHFIQNPDFNTLNEESDKTKMDETTLLRVYAYGTPSCLDPKLADSVKNFVTTVVLHDDVFPRLTPTSCRGLLKHLLHIRETWVKTHMADDLNAIRERARTAWAPRFRQGFTLESSSRSIKHYCKEKLRAGKDQLKSVKNKLVGDGDDEEHKMEIHQAFAKVDEPVFNSFERPSTPSEDLEGEESEPPPQLLLEFLGGVDTRTEGIVIDGDEFFETQELLEQSDDDESIETALQEFQDTLSQMPDDSVISDSWCDDMPPAPQSIEKMESHDTSFDSDAGNEAAPGTVVVEETPLPRMFVPGKIVHIYSQRGVYKAAQVPRTFRELRRISLAGNMLSDHTSKNYYEALLEVQTARAAPERPPQWTAFDQDDTCCCCASRFTWNSTSDSEAQEARDKHNCRSCGGLVCQPCSQNKVPIPSIGLTVSVRVCDRCYNDMGGMSKASSSMTSSFLDVGEDDHRFSSADNSLSPSRQGGVVSPLSQSDHENPAPTIPAANSNNNDPDQRPVRVRERRSMVVDELASRIRSSALTSYS